MWSLLLPGDPPLGNNTKTCPLVIWPGQARTRRLWKKIPHETRSVSFAILLKGTGARETNSTKRKSSTYVLGIVICPEDAKHDYHQSSSAVTECALGRNSKHHVVRWRFQDFFLVSSILLGENPKMWGVSCPVAWNLPRDSSIRTVLENGCRWILLFFGKLSYEFKDFWNPTSGMNHMWTKLYTSASPIGRLAAKLTATPPMIQCV